MNRGVALIFLLSISMLSAQNTTKIVRKTTGKIILDGILNDAAWNDATQFNFFEHKPDWGKQDSLTSMKMTFDHKYLYLALEAKEPNPKKIIDRNLVRDGWYGDDFFAFGIDPNLTKKNSFVFSIYPSGSRYDMAVSNDAVPLGNSTFNSSYDMIWDGKTLINENGWTAEYKIPISNLRFVENNGIVIAGISVVRTQQHLNRSVRIAPLPSQNIPNGTETPSLYQPITLEGLKPRTQLQITSYALGALSTNNNLVDNVYAKNDDENFDVGLDVRYGISPKLTLDATINTDFAQVEIDDQVVNLSRGSIFLPEKRKFFQEQAGLFDFNTGIFSQLFYSRRIGIKDGQIIPVLGGLRLTGEIGSIDIGLLSMQSDKAVLNDESELESENFSVLRLRKKVFNNRSFIGLMATNNMRKDYFNTSIGIDGVFSLPNEKFIITSIATNIDDNFNVYNFIDNTRFAFLFEKRKSDGFFYKVSYEYSAEDFNPQMASLLRQKHHNFFTLLSHGKYNNTKENGLFRYKRWNFIDSDFYFTTDMSRLISWYGNPSWSGAFFSGDKITFQLKGQYESLIEPLSFTDRITIPADNYFTGGIALAYSQGWQRKFVAPMRLEYGGFFDGTNLQFQISPEITLNRHLNISTSWRTNYLDFKDRNVSEWINVVQTKLNLAYNLHLSGSIIGQYNSISDQVFTSARLRYNFRDGHDLYLVYNQDYNTVRDFNTPQLPRFKNRIFTIKYLYTFFK